jgi:SAM-dependent methyltransferase
LEERSDACGCGRVAGRLVLPETKRLRLSFNPLMGLMMQAVVPACGERPAVLEFGNQTFTVDRATLSRIVGRATGLGQDVGGLRAINALDKAARGDRVAAFYRCLGAGSYSAIDVNDRYGSLVMDLNRDLESAYAFHLTYDLVTNSGTGEHIFDQMAVFRNAHKLARPGGLMVHVMPFMNYVNHGFYSFQPNLYHALAVANDYAIVALGVATRGGHGVIAWPGPEVLPSFLVTERRVDLETLLVEPRVPRRRAPRKWIELLAARVPGASRKQRFGLYIHQLLASTGKILVFALLRKTSDAAFAVPIQLRYSEDVAPQLAGRIGENHSVSGAAAS